MGFYVGTFVGFQSTPPVKAATLRTDCYDVRLRFQSTPPVKAATAKALYAKWDGMISIHAAREGGDGGNV